MNTLRISAACVILAGLVVACSDQLIPTAPSETLDTPFLAVDHQVHRFPYSLDEEEPFIVCRGELVQGHGTLMINIQEVYTPSGNLLVRGWIDYPGDTWLEGLDSGVVWSFEKGLNPYTETLKGDFYSEDDFWVQNWTIHEWYRNPELGKLKVSWWGGLKFDKDGNFKLYRDRLVCR